MPKTRFLFEETSQFDENFIKNYNEESDEEYFLEVHPQESAEKYFLKVDAQYPPK